MKQCGGVQSQGVAESWNLRTCFGKSFYLTLRGLDHRPKEILLSVPASSLLMLGRWRIITINGNATAIIKSGQSFPYLQPGKMNIAPVKTSGKAIAAMIDASEMYRLSSTTITHTASAATAQIV
jgi:hypothetical protein